MRQDLQQKFRDLCRQHNLAVTHQRAIIYEALLSMPDHPSPEGLYVRVRQQIPSISLATVYKTISTFLEAGIAREVSLHHGSIRLDSKLEPHHHAVCTNCRSISDLDEAVIGPATMPGAPPQGFLVQRVAVEVLGLCQQCAVFHQTSPGGRSSARKAS